MKCRHIGSASTLLLLLLAMAPSSAARAAAPPANAPARTAARILVVYYSRHGTTEKMAQGVAEGARRIASVEVVVKQVQDTTKEDLAAADGILLGCPTFFANIPGVMKTAMDEWNWKWKVDFTDKVGGAFSTGGGQTGGKEHVVTSLLLFMLSNRMIVAGPLYSDAEGKDIWGEPGSSAMTGPLDPGVSPAELDAARRIGERVARLAKKMKGS
jgi:NAD(P)H dehydrogenase (quinone)